MTTVGTIREVAASAKPQRDSRARFPIIMTVLPPRCEEVSSKRKLQSYRILISYFSRLRSRQAESRLNGVIITVYLTATVNAVRASNAARINAPVAAARKIT
jgi:hypothetical protein